MIPSQELAAAIKSVCGSAPLHDPFTDEQDARNVYECVMSEPVGYKAIGRFEMAVAQRVGRRYAIAVSSGSAALQLCVMAAPHDFNAGAPAQVQVPAMTFAGVAAAVRHAGRQVAFYDTLGPWPPWPGGVSILRDLLGMPEAYNAPRRAGSFTIEDAAGALGSANNYGSSGSFGDCAIISFNTNKIVTTGGGGMVLTDDITIAEQVRHLATTAKIPSVHYYNHATVGFNFRMPNVCAAMGIGQMDRLNEILERKEALAEKYRRVLGELLATVPGWNHWLNHITVPVGARDLVMGALDAVGVQCRALYTPLPSLPPYRTEGKFPVTDLEFATTICLPSGKTACENAGV